jgi:hypothetical protein
MQMLHFNRSNSPWYTTGILMTMKFMDQRGRYQHIAEYDQEELRGISV